MKMSADMKCNSNGNVVDYISMLIIRILVIIVIIIKIDNNNNNIVNIE